MLTSQNEHLNDENHRLSSELHDIKELLGVCESRDPTDVDRAHLKKLVRELKQRNESMTAETRELRRIVEQLKEGKYNELEVGKHMSREEINRLERRLEEAERTREEVARENARMKSESEKVA